MRISYEDTITRLLTSSALLLAVGHSFAADSPPADQPSLYRTYPRLASSCRTSVYLEALATGVQIYECVSKPDATVNVRMGLPCARGALADRSAVRSGSITAGPRGSL